jgi:hypothetical protein
MTSDRLADWLQTIDFNGAPGPTRTGGLLIRSQTLYPTELRAHTIAAQHYSDFRNNPQVPFLCILGPKLGPKW